MKRTMENLHRCHLAFSFINTIGPGILGKHTNSPRRGTEKKPRTRTDTNTLKMAQPRSHKTPTVRDFPSEVQRIIMSNLESPTDVKSWISTSTVNFSHFLEYKAQIFGIHMDLHLLPEALTVLQLRQIHEKSSTPVAVRQLVDVACESLKPAGSRSPRSFMPHDFATILALLGLAEEINCIVSGMRSYRSPPGRLTPPSLPLIKMLTVPPHCDAIELFRLQQAVVTLELYIQCMFRHQNIIEAQEERWLCNRLESLLPKCGGVFYSAFRFISRANYTFLRLACRKVVSVNRISGRPFLTENITLREPAQTLLEALGDPDVLSTSALMQWRSFTSSRRTWKDLERLHKPNVDQMEERRHTDFSATQVCTLHTASGDLPVQRFVCADENNPGSVALTKEYLFQRDENGLTAIASLLTIREQNSWSLLDDINYTWHLVSGGIRPLSRLLRMSRMDRQKELIDDYVRFLSNSQPEIHDRILQGRFSNRTRLRRIFCCESLYK